MLDRLRGRTTSRLGSLGDGGGAGSRVKQLRETFKSPEFRAGLRIDILGFYTTGALMIKFL